MRLSLLFAGAALFASFGALPACAQRAPSELRCSMAGGFGFLVGSDRKLSCVYYRPDGVTEFYVGSSGRIGLDLGPTNALRLAYRVLSENHAPGALAGDFAGPGFGVTLGRGIGADALVGGQARSVTLVPIANQSVTGLNVNAGIGVLHLRYAGREPARQARHPLR